MVLMYSGCVVDLKFRVRVLILDVRRGPVVDRASLDIYQRSNESPIPTVYIGVVRHTALASVQPDLPQRCIRRIDSDIRPTLNGVRYVHYLLLRCKRTRRLLFAKSNSKPTF